MEPLFLSLGEILEIHEQQLERYGGSSGIQDSAEIESAIATPQATNGAGLELDRLTAGMVCLIEKFPSAILKYRHSATPNHGDFTKIKTSELLDVLCAEFRAKASPSLDNEPGWTIRVPPGLRASSPSSTPPPQVDSFRERPWFIVR